MPSGPLEIKICSMLGKAFERWKLNFSRSALFHIETKVCVKYFVHDCLWKEFFDSNLPQEP